MKLKFSKISKISKGRRTGRKNLKKLRNYASSSSSSSSLASFKTIKMMKITNFPKLNIKRKLIMKKFNSGIDYFNVSHYNVDKSSGRVQRKDTPTNKNRLKYSLPMMGATPMFHEKMAGFATDALNMSYDSMMQLGIGGSVLLGLYLADEFRVKQMGYTKMLDKLQNVVEVESNVKPNGLYDGKLVFVKGNLETNTGFKDEDFGLSLNNIIKYERKVKVFEGYEKFNRKDWINSLEEIVGDFKDSQRGIFEKLEANVEKTDILFSNLEFKIENTTPEHLKEAEQWKKELVGKGWKFGYFNESPISDKSRQAEVEQIERAGIQLKGETLPTAGSGKWEKKNMDTAMFRCVYPLNKQDLEKAKIVAEYDLIQQRVKGITEWKNMIKSWKSENSKQELNADELIKIVNDAKDYNQAVTQVKSVVNQMKTAMDANIKQMIKIRFLSGLQEATLKDGFQGKASDLSSFVDKIVEPLSDATAYLADEDHQIQRKGNNKRIRYNFLERLDLHSKTTDAFLLEHGRMQFWEFWLLGSRTWKGLYKPREQLDQFESSLMYKLNKKFEGEKSPLETISTSWDSEKLQVNLGNYRLGQDLKEIAPRSVEPITLTDENIAHFKKKYPTAKQVVKANHFRDSKPYYIVRFNDETPIDARDKNSLKKGDLIVTFDKLAYSPEGSIVAKLNGNTLETGTAVQLKREDPRNKINFVFPFSAPKPEIMKSINKAAKGQKNEENVKFVAKAMVSAYVGSFLYFFWTTETIFWALAYLFVTPTVLNAAKNMAKHPKGPKRQDPSGPL